MSDPKEEKKKESIKGIKRMRSGFSGASTPTYKCDNCGCIRYSECYCTKAASSEANQ